MREVVKLVCSAVGAGVGKTVLIMELINNVAKAHVTTRSHVQLPDTRRAMRGTHVGTASALRTGSPNPLACDVVHGVCRLG